MVKPVQERRLIAHGILHRPHLIFEIFCVNGQISLDAAVHLRINDLADNCDTFIQLLRVRAIDNHACTPFFFTYAHTCTYIICFTIGYDSNLNRASSILFCLFLSIKN